MFISKRFVPLMSIVFLMVRAAMGAETSLIPWGNISKDGLPAGWEVLTISAPIHTSVESVDADHPLVPRLDASEQSRSGLYSPAIAVAPGDVIHISASVRVSNVPDVEGSDGNVMLIAAFDGVGVTANQKLHRIGSAKKKTAGWQVLSGDVTAPPAAATMRLRLGFIYTSGTCWWDGLTVHAVLDVVARPDVIGGRLPSATGGLPLVILNRSGDKQKISIDVTEDKQTRTLDIQLDGSAEQHVTAEFPTQIKPGPLPVDLVVHHQGETAEKEFRVTAPLVVPAALELLPVLPADWLVEDGVPKIDGNVDLSLDPADLAAGQLSIQLIDSSGRTLFRQPIPGPLQHGHNSFSLGLKSLLPVGKYEVAAELQSRGKRLKAKQRWSIVPRSQILTTINADGYLVHNGKTIFPLGLFNGDAKAEESAKAGFTISHEYNETRVFSGVEPDDQAALDFMDSTQKAGMVAVTLVPLDFGFHHEWDAFRRRIRLLKNHPALLVWDEEEGIARGDMTVKDLAMMRQIVHEEDPNHPFIVGDSRDSIQRVLDRSNFFPVDQMDLGMWWWYPIPAIPHAGSGLGGDELTSEQELIPPSFLTQRNTDKPLWVGVQAYKKPGKLGRYPTPIEQRLQAYMSFIYGAKGLMWYAGSVNGGIYIDPVEGHWDDLKALAGELRELAPVLMSPRDQKVTFTPEKAPISAIIKLAGDRVALIAANRNVAAVDVEFAVPTATGSAAVFRENRNVKWAGGKLADHFDPYAVHVYELGK